MTRAEVTFDKGCEMQASLGVLGEGIVSVVGTKCRRAAYIYEVPVTPNEGHGFRTYADLRTAIHVRLRIEIRNNDIKIDSLIYLQYTLSEKVKYEMYRLML
jgi:hypothetical protein